MLVHHFAAPETDRAGTNAREERQLLIPRRGRLSFGESIASRLTVSANTNSLAGHTFGRFSVRGLAAWRYHCFAVSPDLRRSANFFACFALRSHPGRMAVRKKNVSPLPVPVKPYPRNCGPFLGSTILAGSKFIVADWPGGLMWHNHSWLCSSRRNFIRKAQIILPSQMHGCRCRY